MKLKKLIASLTATAALTTATIATADNLQINAADSLKDNILVSCSSAAPQLDSYIGKALPWSLVRLKFFPTATSATCKFYHGTDYLGSGDVSINLIKNTGTLTNIAPAAGHEINGPTVSGTTTLVTITA